MALNTGSVIAKFKSDLTDLKNGIGEAKSMMGGLKSTGVAVGGAIKDSFNDFMSTAKVVGAVGAGAFALLAKSSIDLKSETDKANISLEIMAERFGQNTQKAKMLADSLGKELRIGTGAASEGLQNLIKSGMSLDQASDLMRRFTNEAMTGKSESISLSDAVKNLTFAYATNNSALGNMSGVSENWSDITEKGKKVLEGWNGTANKTLGITPELANQIKAYEKSLKEQGKTLTASDDEMAKYVGLLQLTNLTQGSAQRFQGTYTDNLAMMGLKMTELKLALGELLQNGLNPLVLWFTNSGILDWITRLFGALGSLAENIKALLSGANVKAEIEEFFSLFTGGEMNDATKIMSDLFIKLVFAFQAVAQWISENKEIVQAFFLGLVAAITGLLIIGTITGLITALMNPMTLIILAVGALFAAWQTNFLGIRDLTDAVIQFVVAGFQYLVAFWNDWGGVITSLFTNIWDIIKGIWQLATAILIAVIAVFVGLLTGNWSKAFELLKAAAKNAWAGIVNIFSGAFGAIMDGLNAFVKMFTDKLDWLFVKAREIGAKIKDALAQISPFHKSSPSLVQYVEMGVAKIEDSYQGLASSMQDISMKNYAMDITGASNMMGLVSPQPSSSDNSVTQNIEMNINSNIDVEYVTGRLAFMYRNNI